MDINKEIQLASDKFIEENLPKLIEQSVGKLIKELLDDTFRSYSPIGKQIKEKIEKQLDINLQRYDLVDYNVLVSNAINNSLIGIVNEQAIEPIMGLVKETIGFVERKEMKLSEIHQLVINAAMEDGDEREGEISFHAIKNEQYKWVEVSFDIEGGKSVNDCGLSFIFSFDKGRGDIFSFRSRSHWSNKQNLTPQKITQLSNLEHKIFRLYSAQVKIEADELDFENEWSKEW